MIAASSSACSRMSSPIRLSTARRAKGGVRRHAGKAERAAATASATSAGPARGKVAWTRPVDGFTCSMYPPLPVVLHSPPTRSPGCRSDVWSWPSFMSSPSPTGATERLARLRRPRRHRHHDGTPDLAPLARDEARGAYLIAHRETERWAAVGGPELSVGAAAATFGLSRQRDITYRSPTGRHDARRADVPTGGPNRKAGRDDRHTDTLGGRQYGLQETCARGVLRVGSGGARWPGGQRHCESARGQTIGKLIRNGGSGRRPVPASGRGRRQAAFATERWRDDGLLRASLAMSPPIGPLRTP